MNKTKTKTIKQNLIVLGNGFDLACGEKTSIYDFVNFKLSNPNLSFNYNQLNFIIWLIWHCGSDDLSSKMWREFLKFNNSESLDWMDFEEIINHLVLNEELLKTIEDIFINYSKYKK